MFAVCFFKNGKRFLKKEFDTQIEAEECVLDAGFDNHCEYEIYDIETDRVIDGGEIESTQDIIDGTLNMLFPNNDDGEETDYNDYWRD